MAVPNIFGTATAAIPLSQLDTNFATPVTIGNTAVQLGNTVTSFGNVTLTNVTISSGNVTVSAGSNTAPSITTVGDTNTGIFFPAADTIAFSEGGVESARFDASGNMGLGATPSAWNSAWKGLQVVSSSLVNNGFNDVYLGANYVFDSTSASKYINSDFATLYGQVNGAHQWFNAASGTAGNTISFTQAMTLNASGNLGIGTTSPSTQLHLQSNSATYIQITDVGDGASRIGQNGTALTFGVDGSDGATERARITSAGDLLVGATSAHNFGIPSIQAGGSNSNAVISVRRDTTSAADQVLFYNPNGVVGTITSTGSATAYVTSSDYRLKENIAPMTGALSVVAQLKPCTYTWKVDGSDSQGFIAHELQAVVPDCVTGSKDAVDDEGNPKYQGVDTSFLVATLTAAIQELKAIVDAQAVEIVALKGTA